MQGCNFNLISWHAKHVKTKVHMETSVVSSTNLLWSKPVFGRSEDCKHGVGNREGVVPIMIGNITVVLPNCQGEANKTIHIVPKTITTCDLSENRRIV